MYCYTQNQQWQSIRKDCVAVATDLSSRAFSALGPFASKEFRSRPSCAISLRGTVVVNAAVSVRGETLGVSCACAPRRTSVNRCSCVCTRWPDVHRTFLFFYLLTPLSTTRAEPVLFSHGQRSTSCRFKANRRDISLSPGIHSVHWHLPSKSVVHILRLSSFQLVNQNLHSRLKLDNEIRLFFFFVKNINKQWII